MVVAAEPQLGMAGLRNAEQGRHALVVGNSPWRAGFPVADWQAGPVIACNAYYRDAVRMPDYLCVFDTAMIEEAVTKRVYLQTRLVLRSDERRGTVLAKIPQDEHGRWFHMESEFDFGSLAGTMAIGLAGWLGCASLTLIGYSLSHDNLYLGTPNYRREVSTPEARREPGSRAQDVTRIAKALGVVASLSPGAAVHWVSPGPWLLAKLNGNRSGG